MWAVFMDWVRIALLPLVAFLAWQMWRLRTNDLPHIEIELARLSGILEGRKEQ